MRIGLAFRVFFRTLFDRDFSDRMAALLMGSDIQQAAKPEPKAVSPPATPPPQRSEAVTLLAALQREARFVDLVQEPLGEYSDAQVGAAARDVLRDCSQVIDRMFGLTPLIDQTEGGEVEVPAGYDAARFRLTGNVSGEPPFQGRLIHHGWQATRCDVPVWNGSREAQRIVAPQQVELR